MDERYDLVVIRSSQGGEPPVSMESNGVVREMDALQELPSTVAALRRISFFRYLTDPDLSRLARIGRRRSYAAGDATIEKDSDRGGLFVILSGAAEVEAGGAVHMLGPGDFFGETALLAGSPRTATVLATEPVEAMVLEAMHFRAFLIENPSVAVTLLEGVVDRLNAAQQRLEADRAWR
jgi:CRP/FNR family cyclic AMP-dependent transcriptional regulator